MDEKKEYVLITSPVPTAVKRYLEVKKLNFQTFPFQVLINASQIPYADRNFGFNAWKDCDNFIEGIKGDNDPSRGWAEFLCRAYKRKAFLYHSRMTEEEYREWLKEERKKVKKIKINVDGKVGTGSWIACSSCAHYSPNSLEGRKKLTEIISEEYHKLAREQYAEVDRLSKLIEKNKLKK